MKRIAVLLLACMLVTCVGCMNPPRNTIWVDTDANGVPDALAMDANGDGLPDLDANGHVQIVQGSPSRTTVEAAMRADDYGPGIMAIAGGIAGPLGGGLIGAILIGLGAAWRQAKLGRVLLNTITTVQNARRQLADGNTSALSIVDEALSNQLPETMKMIRVIKDKFAIPSVTEAK